MKRILRKQYLTKKERQRSRQTVQTVSSISIGVNEKERYRSGLRGLFELEKSEYTFQGIREAYAEMTGDKDMIGQYSVGKEENDFSGELTRVLEELVQKEYMRYEHNWRKIVTIRKDIRDFSMQNVYKGGFGNIDIFQDTYPNPMEKREMKESGSFQVYIRASMFTITEQMIKNNDVHVIRRLCESMAQSAYNTLETYVMSLVIGGSQYLQEHNCEYVTPEYINTDLILNTPLYTKENTIAGNITIERLQKIEVDMRERIGHIGRLRGYCIIPHIQDIEYPGVEFLEYSNKYLGGTDQYWYYIVNPRILGSIEIGFLDNKELPRVILANDPSKMRTMTHGGLQYTIVHNYGGGVRDGQGLYQAERV